MKPTFSSNSTSSLTNYSLHTSPASPHYWIPTSTKSPAIKASYTHKGSDTSYDNHSLYTLPSSPKPKIPNTSNCSLQLDLKKSPKSVKSAFSHLQISPNKVLPFSTKSSGTPIAKVLLNKAIPAEAKYPVHTTEEVILPPKLTSPKFTGIPGMTSITPNHKISDALSPKTLAQTNCIKASKQKEQLSGKTPRRPVNVTINLENVEPASVRRLVHPHVEPRDKTPRSGLSPKNTNIRSDIRTPENKTISASSCKNLHYGSTLISKERSAARHETSLTRRTDLSTNRTSKGRNVFDEMERKGQQDTNKVKPTSQAKRMSEVKLFAREGQTSTRGDISESKTKYLTQTPSEVSRRVSNIQEEYKQHDLNTSIENDLIYYQLMMDKSQRSSKTFVTLTKVDSSNRLEDIDVFRGVIDFLCIKSLCVISRVCKKFRSSKHVSAVRDAQCRLIVEGLTDDQQYEFWDFHVDFKYLQREFPLQYTMNIMKNSCFERDILNDVDRTQNFNEISSSRGDSLLKVLIAFSNAFPNIGYVQGLNSIASVFLSHKITESEAYWLLKYFFHKKKMSEVFRDSFKKVHLLNYQLEIYVRNYLPEIVDYLGENDISIGYFATQWFITVFSYDLDLSYLTRIWDLFLVKGWKMIIRMALAILYCLKDEIISKDCDELSGFLKNSVRENIMRISQRTFFQAAFSFKVSNRQLKCLETLYGHSAPLNVIQVSNRNGKLEWKVLPEDFSPRNMSKFTQQDVMDYLNENIDQLRTLNRIKGDSCKELDNYRNISSIHDQLNSGLATDSVSRNHLKFQLASLPGPKSEDFGFIETLSSFGEKIKKMFKKTKNENSIDTYFDVDNPNVSKQMRPTSNKEGGGSYYPLTEREKPGFAFTANRDNKKRTVSGDLTRSTSFKKSIITALRGSEKKLGINLIEPVSLKVEKDEDLSSRLFLSSKTTLPSRTDLHDHVVSEFTVRHDVTPVGPYKGAYAAQDLTHKEHKGSNTLQIGSLLRQKQEDRSFGLSSHAQSLITGLKMNKKSGGSKAPRLSKNESELFSKKNSCASLRYLEKEKDSSRGDLGRSSSQFSLMTNFN